MPDLTKRRRRARGSALAEMPAALYLFILGLALPLIGFITVGVRATFLYFATRDCTYKAAKAQTWAAAQTTAQTVLATDVAAWHGITVPANQPTVYIVTRNLGSGNETQQTSPIAAGSINTQQNVYFIRTNTQAQLDPLLNFGSTIKLWNGIPGLTGPYTVNFTYQVYAENPNGL